MVKSRKQEEFIISAVIGAQKKDKPRRNTKKIDRKERNETRTKWQFRRD